MIRRPALRPTRREFIKAAGAAAGAIPLGCGTTSRAPNILFLIADQHRADVAGFVGNALAETPALDALASTSAVFETMYCQSPLCVPARQSLITGHYPHTHGTFGNNLEFPEGQVTLAGHLKRFGYHTAMIGKAHVNVADFDHVVDKSEMFRAFKAGHPDATHPGDWFLAEDSDYSDTLRGYNPRTLGPGAGAVHYMEADVLAESRDYLERDDSNQPFFLWASFAAPHPPRFAPNEWMERFQSMDVPVWDVLSEAEGRQLFGYMRAMRAQSGMNRASAQDLLGMARSYYAAVAWLDHNVGQLLAALDGRQHTRETIVVYTSDHGDMLGDHGLAGKSTLHEGATRVPCLLRSSQTVAGLRIARPVEHLDLSATLLALAGLPPLPGSTGRSLLPLCADPRRTDWRDEVLSEVYLGGKNEVDVARGEIAVMLRRGKHKYMRISPNERALFDVESDPEERNDIQAAEPDLIAALDARIDARLPESIFVRRKRRSR